MKGWIELSVTKNQIREIANDVLKEYCDYMGLKGNIFTINPYTLAEMLDLDVKTERIEGSCFMSLTSRIGVSCNAIEGDKARRLFELDGRTILLNTSLEEDKGIYFHIAVMYCVAIHILCREEFISDDFCYYGMANITDLSNFDREWAIGALTKELVMPSKILQTVFVKTFGADKMKLLNASIHKDNYVKFCALSVLFCVTPRVLAERCQQLNLIDEFVIP